MSNFFEIVELLNEYDVRYSNHGIPSSPGDGYTSTGDPSIAGNAAQSAPNDQQPIVPSIKPFTDESNHKDKGGILPFPLDDTVYDRLANMYMNASDIFRMIELSTKNTSITLPQKEMLTRHYTFLKEVIKNIEIISRDLEMLEVRD